MNNSIFFFFYNLAHQSNLLDNLIVFFADYLPYVVVALTGLFLLFHHEVLKAESPFRVIWEKKREISVVFASAFLAYFLASIIKIILHTPRPFVALSNVSALFSESSFAFPSGHSAFFAALAFSVFFLHKKAGYVFMFFAFLIGVARIVAGVHFPIDILGGFMLGGIVAGLVAYFVKKI